MSDWANDRDESQSRLTRLEPGPGISRGRYLDYRREGWDRSAFTALDCLIDTEYSEQSSEQIRKNRKWLRALSRDRVVPVRDNRGRVADKTLPGLSPDVLATALGCTQEHILKMLEETAPSLHPVRPIKMLGSHHTCPRTERRYDWRREAATIMVTVENETWPLLVWAERLELPCQHVRRAMRGECSAEEFIQREIKRRSQ